MTRTWSKRHLASLLAAYAAAACVGSVVYASSQVLLERAHPTKALTPISSRDPKVAWVPIVRRPGGLICALGKDERSTCLKPAADQAEVDSFVSEMERVYTDYCTCAKQRGDSGP